VHMTDDPGFVIVLLARPSVLIIAPFFSLLAVAVTLVNVIALFH
jgi:hypothetical protein